MRYRGKRVEIEVIRKAYLEDAWHAACELILSKGAVIHDDAEIIKEFSQLMLIVDEPLGEFPMSAKEDPHMHEWMAANFNEAKKVPELNHAWSYGWRLHHMGAESSDDFTNGHDQLEWVIQQLKKKPASKSATISMLQPAGTDKYIPCVSLLDFKIREGFLWLTVTCRSLDFGKKAIHNFTNLTQIAQNVAKQLDNLPIKLIIHIISAHIYQSEC